MKAVSHPNGKINFMKHYDADLQIYQKDRQDRKEKETKLDDVHNLAWYKYTMKQTKNNNLFSLKLELVDDIRWLRLYTHIFHHCKYSTRERNNTALIFAPWFSEFILQLQVEGCTETS